jgi:hypothetical protein
MKRLNPRSLLVCFVLALLAACNIFQADGGGLAAGTVLPALATTSLTFPSPSPIAPATEAHPAPSITVAAALVASPVPTATQTYLPLVEGQAETQTPVRFAAIGDYGLAGDPEADVAALVAGWTVDFVITLGDNNYPGGAADTIDENIGQYYQAYIYPYSGAYGPGADINRFFPSLGNHDWYSAGAQPYLDYFTLPGTERYYDFQWGPAHLFALDSDENELDGFREDSAQAEWLRGRLAASEAPWKIVYFHHAPYSSGPHGPTSWMQWPFEAWGASAVLAGHDHTYERLEEGGLLYIVNGLGGGARYDFGAPVEGSQVRYNADWGALLVEATGQSLTFQFITRQDVVVDTYTLSAPMR